ncbi:MAG: WGR domain-containing protein [Gammaproteobacteria bacterium]|nr:WGR domain-containing protein [Gammaproteobacteria bacterium]
MRIYLQVQSEPGLPVRYYQIQLQPDMLGGWGVVREWGFQGRSGTVRRNHYDSHDEAMDALEKVRNQQLQKGYRVMFMQGEEGDMNL